MRKLGTNGALSALFKGGALRDDQITPGARARLESLPGVTREIHKSGYFYRLTTALDLKWSANKGVHLAREAQ